MNYVPQHRSVTNVLTFAFKEYVLFQQQEEAHGQARGVASKASDRAAFAWGETADDMCESWPDRTVAVQVVGTISEWRSRMVPGVFTEASPGSFTDLRGDRGDRETLPSGTVQPGGILRCPKAGPPLKPWRHPPKGWVRSFPCARQKERVCLFPARQSLVFHFVPRCAIIPRVTERMRHRKYGRIPAARA